MKKPLPQMAMDFATAESSQPQPEAPAAPILQEKEDPGIPPQPLQESPTHAEPAVGVRIKALKKNLDAPPVIPPKASTTGTTKSTRGRKSLKETSAEADLVAIPADEILFSKQYYTMGEVAEMFRVNQSLLRFWESEFKVLQPRKNKKGDRYFRPADIKSLHLIYHLLRQRKYTIEGAKEFLKKNKKAEDRFEAIQRLEKIRAFLLEWKANL